MAKDENGVKNKDVKLTPLSDPSTKLMKNGDALSTC